MISKSHVIKQTRSGTEQIYRNVYIGWAGYIFGNNITIFKK